MDALLGEPASGWEGGAFSHLDGHLARGGRAARAQRHLLLPALHAVQDAVGSVSRGALGYISKDVSPEDLIKAIRTVNAGRKFIPGDNERNFRNFGN